MSINYVKCKIPDKFANMLNFKPSNHARDLFESSDDLEGMAGVNTEEESEDSDESVDSDASEDDNDCTVMGEHDLFIYIVAV